MTLRDKISYILDTRKGHSLGGVADAILALDEAKGWAALEAATEALANAEDRAEAAEAKLADVIKKWSAAESKAYDLRAAIFRAYRMGLDAAANRLEPKNPRDDWTDFAKQHHADAIEIRAIQPPADLVERAKGGE